MVSWQGGPNLHLVPVEGDYQLNIMNRRGADEYYTHLCEKVVEVCNPIEMRYLSSYSANILCSFPNEGVDYNSCQKIVVPKYGYR